MIGIMTRWYLPCCQDLMKKMYGTSRSLAARTCPSNGTLHHIKELFYSSSRPDELDMIASRIYSLTNITDCWDLCKVGGPFGGQVLSDKRHLHLTLKEQIIKIIFKKNCFHNELMLLLCLC